MVFKSFSSRKGDFIQSCFICCPLYSTVLQDAGIEPSTVVFRTLAVRRPSHSAKSHPQIFFSCLFVEATGPAPTWRPPAPPQLGGHRPRPNRRPPAPPQPPATTTRRGLLTGSPGLWAQSQWPSAWSLLAMKSPGAATTTSDSTATGEPATEAATGGEVTPGPPHAATTEADITAAVPPGAVAAALEAVWSRSAAAVAAGSSAGGGSSPEPWYRAESAKKWIVFTNFSLSNNVLQIFNVLNVHDQHGNEKESNSFFNLLFFNVYIQRSYRNLYMSCFVQM
jgi:hypothetical protein